MKLSLSLKYENRGSYHLNYNKIKDKIKYIELVKYIFTITL